MKNSWIRRSHLIYAVILLILFIVSGDRPPREGQPRLRHPDFDRTYTPGIYKSPQRTRTLPWERYSGSDLYNEFMEHLDEKGILLDEPDALDIWEKHFE